jgi:hypothetical protein
MDFEPDRFTYLFALNRGILLTPFNNMASFHPRPPQLKLIATPKFLASRASVV